MTRRQYTDERLMGSSLERAILSWQTSELAGFMPLRTLGTELARTLLDALVGCNTVMAQVCSEPRSEAARLPE